MATFANLETLGAIRTKLNNLITNFLEPGLTAKSLVLLLASTAFTYSTLSLKSAAAGDIIETKKEGFRYEVMVLGSTDFDLATAGGILLKLLPDDNGEYSFDGMSPFKANNGDNLAKINRLLQTRVQNIGLGVRLGPTINFSNGQYQFSNTISPKCRFRIVGQYTGFNYARGTDFLFPPSTAGLIVNRFNTNGEEVNLDDIFDAGESEIIGIKFIGGRGDAFNELKSGIWLRARAFVYRCAFMEFAGHGIAVMAGSDNNPYQGNANGFILRHCFNDYNRGDGVHIRGTDANAGWCEMMNCTRNDGWGVYEGSFINNFHAGHHSESNYGGAYKSINGSVMLASYVEDGAGSNVEWAGPFYSPSASNLSTNLGLQGPALVTERGNGPVALQNLRGGFRGVQPLITVDIGAEPLSIIASRHNTTTIAYPFRVSWLSDASGAFMRWGESAQNLLNFGNNLTAATYGRAAAVGEHLNIPTFFLGGGSGARALRMEASTPTSGNVARGEVIFLNAPSAAGAAIVHCTTGGVAGSTAVFKNAANISA